MPEDISPPPCRRLLMTADTLGGVWTYALELSRVFGRHGIEVGLATMGARPNHGQREAAARLRNVRLFESDFKLEWMQDPWDDVEAAGRWLLQLESIFDPDLVHLNGYAHAALPWTRPRMVVAHSCVLTWWEAVRGGQAPASWNRYRSEVIRGLSAADLVVAPTQALLAALGRHYGPLPKSRVIPNGRDPSSFPPGSKKDLVLAAGRLWDPAKNVTVLECIAAQLDWPVYLAGAEKGPDGGAVHFNSIRFLGPLDPDTLAIWYGRASIYALPARYEPFGLSVLEAALAGCALVLGDIPTLRENWGDCALFVPPNDTRALREALEALIRDPAWRSELAARTRERALEFTAERMTSGYFSAYRQLLGRAKAAA